MSIPPVSGSSPISPLGDTPIDLLQTELEQWAQTAHLDPNGDYNLPPNIQLAMQSDQIFTNYDTQNFPNLKFQGILKTFEDALVEYRQKTPEGQQSVDGFTNFFMNDFTINGSTASQTSIYYVLPGITPEGVDSLKGILGSNFSPNDANHMDMAIFNMASFQQWGQVHYDQLTNGYLGMHDSDAEAAVNWCTSNGLGYLLNNGDNYRAGNAGPQGYIDFTNQMAGSWGNYQIPQDSPWPDENAWAVFSGNASNIMWGLAFNPRDLSPNFIKW